MKHITIIEDNYITGVKYGTVEIYSKPIIVNQDKVKNAFKKLQSERTAKIRAEKTKHK